MGVENFENERQVSNEEWEQLKQQAQHYYDRALSITSEKEKVSGSCRHILNNLATGLLLVLRRETPEDRRPQLNERTTSNINYIKRYLALLDEFPEFGVKEQSPIVAALPEIFRQHLGAEELVDAYEKELRKE